LGRYSRARFAGSPALFEPLSCRALGFAGRIIDLAEFRILNLLNRVTQSLAETDPVSFYFAIGGIASGLHGHNHAIDALESVDYRSLAISIVSFMVCSTPI
jgi:hypothetical protein